jgi:hypothetical protein
MALEIARLQAAFELLDEASPTIDAIERAMGDLESALGVTRDEVKKTREELDDLTKAGEMTEKAVKALGITAQEYYKVLANNQALQKAAEDMDRLQVSATQMNKAFNENAQRSGMAMAGMHDQALAMDKGMSDALQRTGMEMSRLQDEAIAMDKAMQKPAQTGQTLAITLGNILADQIQVAAGKFKNFFTESANLAVKLEMLENVSRSLGKSQGYSAGEVDALAASIAKQGITAIASRESINKMVQAGLDLNKAQKLARLAQDAGTIGNINSSEAFSRLIHGVTTMQVETLRNVGIVINSKEALKAYADQLGKTTEDLSGAEKQQAFFNEVLKQGEKITGSYETRQGTAGGQMLSMARIQENAMISIGNSLKPLKEWSVQLETMFWKNVEKYPQAWTVLGAAIVVAAGAYGAYLSIQRLDLMTKAGEAVTFLSFSYNTLAASVTRAAAASGVAAAGGFTALAGSIWASVTAFLALDVAAAPLLAVAAAVIAVGAAAMYLTDAAGKMFGIFDTGDDVIDEATNSVGIFTAAMVVIPDVFNGVKNAASEAWKWISSAGEAAAEIITGAWSKFQDFVSDLWSKFAANANSAFESLTGGLNLTQLLTGAWETLKSALKNATDGAVNFILSFGPMRGLVGILGSVAAGIKAVWDAIVKAKDAAKEWVLTMMYGAEMDAKKRGNENFIREAREQSLAAGQAEIKTLKEATEWYSKQAKGIQEKFKALEASAAGQAVIRKTQKEEIRERLEEDRKRDIIEKAKTFMPGKKKDVKITFEYAEQILKEAAAMGLYKKALTEGEKAAEKAAKAHDVLAKKIESVKMAAMKGIQSEQGEMDMRTATGTHDPAVIAAAQAKKVLDESEVAIAAAKKQYADLVVAAKGAKIPEDVTASYERWYALIRENAGQKADAIINKDVLDDLKKLGPSLDEVGAKFKSMQAAMAMKLDNKGMFIDTLPDDAIKGYVSAMEPLIKSQQLTAEQHKALGPIFEEAYKRGIVGADQLTLSQGKVSAETLKLQSMFGATADQINAKFQEIQRGIAASGGISNMLKVNPAAAKGAVNALQEISKSTLLAAENQKTLEGQMTLAGDAGVKSADAIDLAHQMAQKSVQKWSSVFQGLIGFAGMFGQTAAAAAQIASNSFQEFAAAAKMAQDAKNMSGPGMDKKAFDVAKDLFKQGKLPTKDVDNFKKATAEAEAKNAKLMAGIGATAAVAGMLGDKLQKSTNPSVQKLGGALSGAAAGAKMGMAFGPWGAAVGAAAGAVIGFINKAKQMKAEMKKLNDEFVKSHGGLDKLKEKAKQAGIDVEKAMKAKTPEQLKKQLEEVNKQLEAFNELIEMSGGSMEGLKQKAADAGVSLQEIWDAKTPDEYLKATEAVKKSLQDWDKANEKLQSAMDKYGISVDQLGPKFRQAGLDKIGVGLLESFELLKAAGADVGLITEKMSADMSDYVSRAVAAGSTVPLAMKPMIEQMIANGDLLDANGDAYDSLADSGINFAQTLEEGIQSAVKAIEELVAVLAKGFNIPVNVSQGSGGGGRPPGHTNTMGGAETDAAYQESQGNSFAGGSGGFKDFGSGTPAVLHGIEAVIKPEEMRSILSAAFAGIVPMFEGGRSEGAEIAAALKIVQGTIAAAKDDARGALDSGVALDALKGVREFPRMPVGQSPAGGTSGTNLAVPPGESISVQPQSKNEGVQPIRVEVHIGPDKLYDLITKATKTGQVRVHPEAVKSF